MKKVFMALFIPLVALCGGIEDGFRNPPKQCALQAWWHWIDDCVTKEGIARDLKAMAEAGISTAHIFSPKMTNLKPTATIMTPEWIELFAYAIHEAKKNGLELGFHNCPGWSSSGGPWITPENSMKNVVGSAVDVSLSDLPEDGMKLPEPISNCGFYGDIEVFAFPVAKVPRIKSGGVPSKVPLLANDEMEYVVEYESPFAPKLAALDIATPNFYLTVGIDSWTDGEWVRRGERTFKCFKASENIKTIPLSDGAASERWRYVFRFLNPPPWICRKDIPLRVAELGFWPLDGGGASIRHGDIVRLKDAVKDGRIEAAALESRLDAGKSEVWRIVRTGYTTTGAGPAPATIKGLECDKLSRKGIDAHWRAMPAKLLALPDAKDVVKYVIIDSYEVGGQNWTEELPSEFKKRTGRDLGDFLLAMVGYSVGSEAETAKFNDDLRGVLRELFAENYYDRFCELCHESGVKAILEPYWGPFDVTRCSRNGDVLTGEFWIGRPMDDNILPVVAAARKWKKNIVAAEAFTTEAQEGRWQITPEQLRQVGDAAWVRGINQFVLHSYLHQPFVDRKPGTSLQRHGTQLNVNTTWWPQMRVWTDYVRRGQFLLQYGHIAKDRHDIAQGKIEALVREGDGGERIWFLRNKGGEHVREALALYSATGLPVCEFDAIRGRIWEAAREDGNVVADLAPGESRFFVFAPGLKGEKRPVAGAEIMDMSQGWTIAAFSGLAAPAAPVAANGLFDWSRSDDERLRYFSGTADYVREGRFPAGILDLGDVREIAEVRVDGALAGTLAYRPYRIEIPAGNRLEVRVVNTWPNRLIGDAIRRSRGEEPYTWSNWLGGWDATDALRPAGLIGPVKLYNL